MGDSPPSTDGPTHDQAGPIIQYSRSTLIALYDSPLVPTRLDGMKPLNEWFGELHELPSSPPVRNRDIPSTSSSSNARSNPSTNNQSSLMRDRPNPFANFGRFGVDGGLEGDVLAFVNKSNSTSSTSSSNTMLGANHDKRSTMRDGAIKEGRNGTRIEGKLGGGLGGGSAFSTGSRGGRERDNTGLSTSIGSGTRGEIGGRRDGEKRDRRAPDEGGWRSVGTSDRDRRTGRSTTDQLSRDSRDPRPDRRERSEFGGQSNNTARGGRQPAWMDDDARDASNPSWMDAPVSSDQFELGGRALSRDRAREAAKDRSSTGAGEKLAGAPEGGIDSIAAFKKQMKELERIKAGGDPNEQPESVFASLVKTSGDNEPKPSVFESLGLGAGGMVGSTANEGVDAAPREGGRSSRFAKFFDGKPPSAAETSQPAPSVFDELLGGSKNEASAPSKDAESMARLMGMLQFSSARSTSPVNVKSPPPPPTMNDPSHSSESHINGDRSRQSSGGSRFAFSQPSSQSTASSAPPPQSQSRTPSGSMISPTQSQSLSSPPPAQSFPQPTHTFALPPLSPPSALERRSQQQQSGQDDFVSHSRSASTKAQTSPPVAANYTLPPPNSAPPPSSSNNGPPPLPHFLQMLNGMQPGQPQNGAASRPLPPANHNGNGRPGSQPPTLSPHPQPQQGQGQPPHFTGQIPPHHMMGFGGSPPPPELLRAMSPPGSQPSFPIGLPPSPLPNGLPRMPPPQGGNPNGPPPPPFMMFPSPPPGANGVPHPMTYGMPPPHPHQFRPPPQGMFGGPGVPDLMALLNSGGARNGGGIASAPLPPRAQPPQQHGGQMPDMRHFMSPPPQQQGLPLSPPYHMDPNSQQ